MLCYVILCYIVLYCIVLYDIISYHIILYYVMLCYVILYYIILYILWNLDEALSSPLPGKQTKCSGVSATHCTQRGAHCACNTLVPETGPPFWKPFLLLAIVRPVFEAGFWPHFWDHERANRSCSTVLTARISSICWRQPSFCNASRHGHTHPYNTVCIYYIITRSSTCCCRNVM